MNNSLYTASSAKLLNLTLERSDILKRKQESIQTSLLQAKFVDLLEATNMMTSNPRKRKRAICLNSKKMLNTGETSEKREKKDEEEEEFMDWIDHEFCEDLPESFMAKLKI